ncbi:hypothetical protein DEF23_20865 [Marinitenerispora sediminis]|uniref:Uncharacterized protein n=2 Tax=Marinitenerispora sediminis TaxID=1931232 RepID=A0A368T768_9ACTN|nr:hypothetical protein DEF23_20865 [Marinitenerispora sediminis]RCV59340.1 hypothetical protein DEF24_10240 [Marinitenerispora sediminis]
MPDYNQEIATIDVAIPSDAEYDVGIDFDGPWVEFSRPRDNVPAIRIRIVGGDPDERTVMADQMVIALRQLADQYAYHGVLAGGAR